MSFQNEKVMISKLINSKSRKHQRNTSQNPKRSESLGNTQ